MSSIVIGFGGTGAKIVHSFVMLAASGAVKLSQPVKVLLVDQDDKNGNTQRAAEAITLYRQIREKVMDGVDDNVRPLNVQIEIYSHVIWQPLKGEGKTLGAAFRYDAQSGPDDITSRLLEFLYSPQELVETTLGEGFRGHPSIGAPVFANTLDFEDEPWHSVWADIEQGIKSSGSTVVLCGSIFGGTGASGIPSTCKILRQRLNDQGAAGDRGRVVLNLAMPYFTIREEKGAGLQAHGNNFPANSKAALQYYHDARYLEFCDELYLIGENDPAPIEVAAKGSKLQRNSAHPVELFAACNIVSALDSDETGNLVLTQRAHAGTYGWDDLPLNDDHAKYGPGYVRARMAAFARTCYAAQSLHNALQNYKKQGSLGDLAWLKDYFAETRDIDLEKIKQFERLAQLFLEWAGEMQLSAASILSNERTYRADWFNPDNIVSGRASDMTVQLKTLDPDLMGTLLQPRLSEETYTFRMLHHDLQRKPAGSMRPGLAGLICDIYRESGRTLPAFGSALVKQGDDHA